MNNLEVIALIDDNANDLRLWQEKFQLAGIQTVLFTERQAFARSIARGDHYDAVVLDWYFEDETSSVIARVILESDIRQNRYIPVFVYTNENDVAEVEIGTLPSPFNKIPVISKSETDAAALTAKIQSWYTASTSARLARDWRDARRRAFEQSLYDLEQIDGESLQRTLQHVLHLDSGISSDIEHAMDFLERFVARRVLTDEYFRQALRTELDNARRQPGFKLKGIREQALINAHRYVPLSPRSGWVQTGDIIQLVPIARPSLLKIAIVITPACDLDTGKCVELRLILAEKTELTKEQNDSEVVLQAVWSVDEKVYHNYLLNFHRTLFITDRVFSDAPGNRQGQVIAYAHTFSDMFGQEFKLHPVCRLDDPYRADVLQKFSSHAARIGIP